MRAAGGESRRNLLRRSAVNSREGTRVPVVKGVRTHAERRSRPRSERARACPVPPVAPVGLGWIGIRLARAGRADGAGRRAEDRSAGGEGGRPRGARGRGGGPPAPPELPARLRLRARLAARVHRLPG